MSTPRHTRRRGLDLSKPAHRSYIYRAAMGLLPLLVVAGVVTDQWVPAIAGALGALLVPALADANTPTHDG